MQVDKIITPVVRNKAEGLTKKVQRACSDSITEFNDKAGEIAGRTKVLLTSTKEITDEEFIRVKEELKKKMMERNFSQEVINDILWSVTKKSHKLAKILINDEYAHSNDVKEILSTLRNAQGFRKADGTPSVIINYSLLEDAAKKRNYPACSEISKDYFFHHHRTQRITSTDQIEDMTTEVMKRGTYKPRISTLPALSHEEFNKQMNEIQTLIKNKRDWSKGEAEQLKYFINTENVELIKVLAEDSDVSLKYMRFVTSWANSENTELMLRAALNKDYQGLCHVAGYAHIDEKKGLASVGKIRINKFETLDARFAGFRRKNTMHNLNNEQESFQVNPDYAGFKREGTRTTHQMDANQKSFHDIVKEYCTDDIAEAAKVLLEDSSFDNEMVVQILQKMTIDNVKTFKKAIIDKDFVTLEKLCGKKFSQKDIDIAREKMKIEFKTTSTTGRITRADFIRYIDDKFIHMDKIDANNLKDSEIRNLAKLLGTTEEQIKNMDKREYRRLCLKTHPDKNPNDSMANEVFRILNKIFLGR